MTVYALVASAKIQALSTEIAQLLVLAIALP